MSRISRVLFPDSSLSRTLSPTRDRLSGVDSLAGITTHEVEEVAHMDQEKENDDKKNKTKRSTRRNKPQSRVHVTSSEPLGNSLMNIGQCPVVQEKKKEMNSSKSRTGTMASSRRNNNPFGVFASLGNLNSQSSCKKKKSFVSFVVEHKNDTKSKRDERQKKRAASREKIYERRNQKSSKRNQKRTLKSEISDENECDENDCEGVVFESDEVDVVSPVSIPRTKRLDNKSTPVQTHDQNEVSKRRSKKYLDQAILSPSVAPKPLKRMDNRSTPDLKTSQTQLQCTESSHNFDEIHAQAQAVLKAAEQARSIVSITDVSSISLDEIENIAKIQAKAIIVANPEMSLHENSKNTKPSLEQINRQIDLQTKALIHAYTAALKHETSIASDETIVESQSFKVTKLIGNDSVTSPKSISNTQVDVMVEQDNDDRIAVLSNEQTAQTSYDSGNDVRPIDETEKLDNECPEKPDSFEEKQNQDEESDTYKQIDADSKADDDHIAESIVPNHSMTEKNTSNDMTTEKNTDHQLCTNNFEGNTDEAEVFQHNNEIYASKESTDEIETSQSEAKNEHDPPQQLSSIEVKQTDANSDHDQLQHSCDTLSRKNIELNEYKSYVGRRVVGYFPRFKKYYRGTVINFYVNDDEVIFRVKYDDGDEEFINYNDEYAIEGRDLKRLLENFDKHGEETISKPKDKKKQRKAKTAKGQELNENEHTSDRPRRHVKQVERLELTFRRKKKKQSDNKVSDETLQCLDTTIEPQQEDVKHVSHKVSKTKNCNRSKKSQKMQKEENKISEENVNCSQNDLKANGGGENIETNEYLKRREERIAKNQERLEKLGLSKSVEQLPKRQSNMSSRSTSCTTPKNKDIVTRRSERNRKSVTFTSYDDASEGEDTQKTCEVRTEKMIEEEVDKDGWTATSISLLKKAHSTIDPLTSNFWGKVAETVGGKTGEECRDKWFELSNVNDAKPKLSSRSKGLPIASDDEQNDDDIFNSTPYRENRMKIHLDSSCSSRKPLSRLSDILSSPIFNKLNTMKKMEGSVDGDDESPRRFRSQYKSYVKEIKAGGFGRSKRPKDKKKAPQLLSKSRLYASAESGEIQMRGLVSPGGTFKLEKPDIDEIEDAFLHEDELDNVSDDCGLY